MVAPSTDLAQVFVHVQARIDRTEMEARLKAEAAGLGMTVPIKADFTAWRAEMAKAQRDIERATRETARDAEREAKSSFDRVAKVLNSLPLIGGLGGTGLKIVTGAIIAGAPAINAALLGAFSGGGIAAGIAISLKDPLVKASFQELGTSIMSVLSESAKPITNELLKTIPVLKAAFEDIAPDLTSLFSKLTGPIEAIGNNLSAFFQNLMPGFNAAAETGGQVLEKFAELLPGLGTSISNFLSSLSSSSTGAVQGMEVLIKLFEQLLEILGSFVGIVSKALGPVLIAVNALLPALKTLVTVGVLVFGVFKTIAALSALAAIRLEAMALSSMVAAGGLVAVGDGAAAASLGVNLLKAALGPIGILLTVVGLVIAAVMSFRDQAGDSNENVVSLTDSLFKLGEAYEAGGTAASEGVRNLVLQDELLKSLIQSTQKYGVTLDDVAGAAAGNAEAQEKVRKALQANVDEAQKALDASVEASLGWGEFWKVWEWGDQEDAAEKARGALDKANDAVKAFNAEAQKWKENRELQDQLTTAALESADAFTRLTARAELFGRTLEILGNQFKVLNAGTNFAVGTVNAFFDQFNQPIIDAIDHLDAFQRANDAVVSAVQSSADSVTKAVDSGKKAVQSARDAYTQSSEAVTSAKEAEAAAIKNVAKAQEQEVKAQRDLVKAQAGAKEAQKDLNDARKEALQDLIDLRRAVRDIGNEEEDAAIKVLSATEAADATRFLAPGDIRRRQALLDLSNATQAYNDKKEDDITLRKRLRDEEAKGIEGSDKVIAALQKVADAQTRIKEARQAIVEAHNGVIEAEKAVGKAHDKVTEALGKQATAYAAIGTASKKAAEDVAEAQAKAKNAITLQLVQSQLEASKALISDRIKQLISGGADEADATAIAIREFNDRNEKIRREDIKLGGNKKTINDIVDAYNLIKAAPEINKIINIGLNSTNLSQVDKQMSDWVSQLVSKKTVLVEMGGMGHAKETTEVWANDLMNAGALNEGKLVITPQFNTDDPKFKTAVADFRNNVITPFTNFFDSTVPTKFANVKNTKAPWKTFTTDLRTIWNEQIGTPLSNWFTKTLPGYFNDLKKNKPTWKTFWTDLKNDWTALFATPIGTFFTKTFPGYLTSSGMNTTNAMIGVLNSGITAINAVTKEFGVTIKTITPIKKAMGGPIEGPGTTTSDSVPTMLSRGEFVHNAKAVEYYGPDFMHAVNNRMLPRMATGGSIDELIRAGRASGLRLGELYTNPAGYAGHAHGRTGGWHDVSRAVDFNSPGSGAQPGERKIAEYFAKTFGKNLLELIWTPPSGYEGYYIKNGKVAPGVYSYDTKNAHRDHVHVAANEGFSKGIGLGLALALSGNFLPGDDATNEKLQKILTDTTGKTKPFGLIGKLGGAQFAAMMNAMILGDPASGGGGATAGAGSAVVARIARDTARGMSADDKVLLSLFEAGLVESGMRNLTWGDRDSVGYLQQRPSQGWKNPMDIPTATRSFVRKAMQNEDRFRTAGRLAQSVQISAFPERYDQARANAIKLIQSVESGYHAGDFDNGGWLKSPINGTGKPEAVLDPRQSEAFVKFVEMIADNGGVRNEAPVVINTYNPLPERASESIPKAARRVRNRLGR